MAINDWDDDREWWWRDGKQRVKITCAELNDLDDLEKDSTQPGSLSAHINMLLSVYNKIPKKLQDQAYLSLDSYYESEDVRGEVFYVREMTKEEAAEENKDRSYRRKREEEKEKRQYEILKEKYG